MYTGQLFIQMIQEDEHILIAEMTELKAMRAFKMKEIKWLTSLRDSLWNKFSGLSGKKKNEAPTGLRTGMNNI